MPDRYSTFYIKSRAFNAHVQPNSINSQRPLILAFAAIRMKTPNLITSPLFLSPHHFPHRLTPYHFPRFRFLSHSIYFFFFFEGFGESDKKIYEGSPPLCARYLNIFLAPEKYPIPKNGTHFDRKLAQSFYAFSVPTKGRGGIPSTDVKRGPGVLVLQGEAN